MAAYWHAHAGLPDLAVDRVCVCVLCAMCDVRECVFVYVYWRYKTPATRRQMQSDVHGTNHMRKARQMRRIFASFQDSREGGSTSRGLQRSRLWVPPVRMIVILSPGTLDSC